MGYSNLFLTPEWFYSHAAGNEANVEVYANFTGFLWETARDYNALVVFAEVCGLLQPSCSSFVQHHVHAIAYHPIIFRRYMSFVMQHRYYGESQPFGALPAPWIGIHILP